MVGRELLDAVGFDPDDPGVRDALHDARASERVVDVLVDLRKKAGLSQTDVAREMRTSRAAVATFEQAGGDPHLSTVQRYARAVGAQLDLTVTRAPQSPARAVVQQAEDSRCR
jgi:transcriptional regulator with XRE-family HTH domain